MELINVDLKEFGVYFAALREKSGYRSQRELADKSNISHSTINRIESGSHKASPETLNTLAEHLKGISYQELLVKVGYIPDSLEVQTQEKSNDDLGRAFFDGADQYSEEELEIARAAAKAAVEGYRKGLNKKK
jgi:transcriptional regulator with XRE-family HTH domain